MAGRNKDGRELGVGCLVLLILGLLIAACGQVVSLVIPDDEPQASTDADVREKHREERSRSLAQAATDICNDATVLYASLVAVDQRHRPPRAICQRVDLTYVAVTIGERDRRWWRVVKRGNRWANVSRTKSGRIPHQAPTEQYVSPAPDLFMPPAPNPYAPPAPDPYNGPRCYAPGGKTYRPC